MAEKITTGEKVGYSPEVGWQRFADGAQWRLRRGEDFEQPAAQARRAFLSWASRRGVGTHSSVVDDDTLIVQVVPREEGDEVAAERGPAPAGAR